MMRFSQSGQGLAEYTLIGVMVLVVTIPSVLIFGGDFMGLLTSLFNQMQKSVVAQASPLSAAQLAQSGDQMVSTYKGGPKADITIQLKDGTVINLKDYPQDLQKYVEASGSNGATTEILAQLDTLIAQLQKSPSIDPMELASLKSLSNQGHRLANIEAALENAYKSAGTNVSYDTLPVMLDGKTYVAKDLWWMLGWHGTDLAPVNISNPLLNTNAGTELNQFLNLYFQAESSGALNDPSVKTVVSAMSGQIAFLTEVLEDTTYNVSAGTFGVSSIDSYQASLISHFDSAQICTAGGSQDSGVLCK